MATLSKILGEQKNIAELLDEEQLRTIGNSVKEGFDIDLQSREIWEKDCVDYLKLAMQICEEKSFPWPGAANVKYPAIATAAMQFSARAYPSLVPSNGRIVQVGITGQGNPRKSQRAGDVGKYLSYQLLQEMDGWEEGMDNLLLQLPIFGVSFKKTYYDANKGKNCSDVVHPFNFVVNYWTKDLESCSRATEILYRDKRYIFENTRRGLYRDVDLGTPSIAENFKERINVSKNMVEPEQEDEFSPYMLLEQHTYLDLDDDGYSEPYVVLVEYNSAEVLRITPRYFEEDIEFNEKGEVVHIKPTGHYTKYPFIPSPDGSFYTRGFGHLLGPLNESINTILNQLIDAGTLSNLQSGFIGKGIKIRQGDVRFKPGEWKPVNNMGQDLKSQVFPLPVREPSNVLFQLLGMLVQSGKELASVAEIFVGKMPGQNTPAYTTQQTIEQGMKLFTAIYKRVYRAMSDEFRKLYCLNYYYFDEEAYNTVMDKDGLSREDFGKSDKDIYPAADPTASSEFEKEQKIQRVGQYIQLGTINPLSYTVWALKNFDLTEQETQFLIEGSRAASPPQPDPEQQAMQQEAQMKQGESMMKMELEKMKLLLKQKDAQLNMVMKQQEHAMNMKMKKEEFVMEQQKNAVSNALDIQAQQDKHTQAMQQQKDKASQKPKPKNSK